LNYYFQWDPKKARNNNRKHGVSFERAASIFRDPRALSIFDDEHSIEEDRWITLGLDASGILLVVCHTFEQETKDSCRVRIFSARKAAKSEMNQYGG
jgi:uncharacterized DUF497 family protein